MTAPDHGDEEINRLVALCAERPDDAIEYAIEYGMILARRASTPSSIAPHAVIADVIRRLEATRTFLAGEELYGFADDCRRMATDLSALSAIVPRRRQQMIDHRKAQKCSHQTPYQMISPVNFCSWPYCACLREGQEMQGLRYEDVKGHDAAHGEKGESK